MFKLSKKTSYKWPVKVQIPGNQAFQESTFTAEFAFATQSQIDAIQKDPDSSDILDKVFIGWDDLLDEDGAPLSFTPENKAALLDLPYVKMGVARAFFGSIAGRLPKT